ncbi:hypothetical protein ACWD4O_37835 [Streptomyces sp. NPDC002623]
MTGGPSAVPPTETDFDHIVVGAGAGGGPPAADLAAGRNHARHGFDGRLPTALVDPNDWRAQTHALKGLWQLQASDVLPATVQGGPR